MRKKYGQTTHLCIQNVVFVSKFNRSHWSVFVYMQANCNRASHQWRGMEFHVARHTGEHIFTLFWNYFNGKVSIKLSAEQIIWTIFYLLCSIPCCRHTHTRMHNVFSYLNCKMKNNNPIFSIPAHSKRSFVCSSSSIIFLCQVVN